MLGREPKPGLRPACLIRSDLRCHNGVVHLIDSVILPDKIEGSKIVRSNKLDWLDHAVTEQDEKEEDQYAITIN